MRPRERRESGEQDLFRSRLDQTIDMTHALVKLSCAIDWRFLEAQFGSVYSDGSGCPPLPTDDVQNLSHNWVGLAAPNLADLEVAKRNQASRRAPPWQTIHRVR